jgi:hypothetical protein
MHRVATRRSMLMVEFIGAVRRHFRASVLRSASWHLADMVFVHSAVRFGELSGTGCTPREVQNAGPRVTLTLRQRKNWRRVRRAEQDHLIGYQGFAGSCSRRHA